MEKRKPHIAMILPDRIDHVVGGMGVQAKYLIEHLKNDFEFSVHEYPDNTTIPYHRGVENPLPKIQHGGLNTLTGQIAYFASIMKMVEAGKKPDLIHVLDYTEFLAGVYAKDVLKIPLVVSMQLSSFLMHEAGLFAAREPHSPDGIAIENSMKEMELKGLHAADHIIHVSSVYKQFFSQIPDLDQKSTYIPNGVDLKAWNTFTHAPLPGNGRLKVLYLGRFASQKNIEALITAKIPPSIDLIFAGSPDSGPKNIFDAIIEKTKREKNVHFIGPIYDQQKINVLRSVDALIIPSKHECHPLVMHEALAGGAILISSGVGDLGTVVPKDIQIDCGITPQSISLAFEYFAHINNEEILRRKQAALEIVKNYDWSRAAEATKQVYLSLLPKL